LTKKNVSAFRTQSLERILGDKAEIFFQSLERTMKVNSKALNKKNKPKPQKINL
jgi:hypothetical protein